MHNPRLVIALVGVAFCLVYARPVSAQGTSVDDLLANGWHRYSEELDFEGALEAYEAATQHPDAAEEQLLEAYEYLAACRFALGNSDGARRALTELLRINQEQSLHDPSHSPDLLQMLEDLRGTVTPEPEIPPPPTPPPPLVDTERPPGVSGLDTDEPGSGGTGDEPGRGDRRPWYRTWWFWTIAGVVVAGATVGIAVGATSGGEAEPPQGDLSPGVVHLPCSIRF